ncbi:MAG: long-chain fatty acid--CoA ligase [Treponema sp.]|nr:MAG: long-chain fatty acid--CoA ligase [Treponema sp.]
MSYKTLPLMLKKTSEDYPEVIAQYYKNENKEFVSITYQEFYEIVLNCASGLLKFGCTREDKIGLISDNRPEWMYSSLGIASIGAADVPRGCDATEQELIYILSFTECKTVIVENESQVKKILKNFSSFPSLKQIIVIDSFDFSILEKNDCNIIAFDEVLKTGKAARFETNPEAEIEKGSREDIATIIFTSGTTGTPKGVMLSHGNFLAQIDELSERLHLFPGARAISVLPVWHSFERACEYIMIRNATSIIYSKPIAAVLLPDIAELNPHIFPSVPRIWESIYDAIMKMMKKKGGITYLIFKLSLGIGSVWKKQQLKLKGQVSKFYQADKILNPLTAFLPVVFLYPFYKLADVLVFKNIRAKLGKNFHTIGGVSGGGALPENIDMFYATAGIRLLEGYGITETSPVISVRPVDKPVFGNVGKPLKCLDAKILDDSGNALSVGTIGSILIKGPTVMKGYYNAPERTEEAIDENGWFDTGDIGCLTLDGELVITGRKKDTIVLRGGENLEPIPIEMKLQESQYIKTAVLLGQDQKYLAALLLVDEVFLKMWAKRHHIKEQSIDELIKIPAVKKLYESEIKTLVSAKNGFKIFERISKFTLLTKDFETGVELSAKSEIMRHKINEIYAEEIQKLFV